MLRLPLLRSFVGSTDRRSRHLVTAQDRCCSGPFSYIPVMAPLVLVHGITESKQSWDPLLDALSIDPASDVRRTVLAVDLRGHGEATRTPPFDLVAMATDVLAEMGTAGIAPRDAVIIGHSLGGTVVTAMAAVTEFRAVVNVDQPLRLADFQTALRQLEPLLRGDDANFFAAITMVFDAMRGPLSDEQYGRLTALRRPERTVVLGVWDPIFTLESGDLDAMVASMTRAITSPYLSLHGIDPGSEYGGWLTQNITGAKTEVWPDHGHYPHLVDSRRFVDRINAFIESTRS